jgi:hypothetical protein
MSESGHAKTDSATRSDNAEMVDQSMERSSSSKKKNEDAFLHFINQWRK